MADLMGTIHDILSRKPAVPTGRETTLDTRNTFPTGWIEVHQFVRNGDNNEYTSWAGPLLEETSEVWVLEIYGFRMSFLKEHWIS